MILTIQSTTFGAYGGIPTYNRLVCRVLNGLSGGEETDVLIATDKQCEIERPAREFPGLRVQAFDHNRVGLVLRFIRLGLTRPYDLILLGHVNYAPLGWLLKKLRPRTRYGVILYGVDAWQRLPWLKRRALQQADFLVSISDYTMQRAMQMNSLVGDAIYLLPNALEPVAIDSLTRDIATPGTVGSRLLSVCRLENTERYKGVDKVIEILAQLSKAVPDIQYTVVGGGTDLERHKQLAQKCGVAERVHFKGFVSDEALQACYRDCDVFVMPSAGEGFGFVFLEAMKYGKVVVAANSGGAPEVVEDGVTGFLVEYGDQKQLADSLTELCLDPEKRMRLGSAGFQRLQDRFTFPHFKQKLKEILAAELKVTINSLHEFPVDTANTVG